MTRSVFLALCIGLIAISGPEPADAQPPTTAQTVSVYKPDGTRHCDPAPEISLETMAHQLLEHDIAVHARRKAHDGREGVAVCGNPTGSINVYEISESDLPEALKLGFQRLDGNGGERR